MTNKTTQEIEATPAFNVKFDRIDNGHMTNNINTYLEMNYSKLNAQKSPSHTTWTPSEITGGVCNGWSFLAALNASKGNAALKEFYKKSALLTNWDGSEATLRDPKALPVEFQDRYKNLDDLFDELTNDIYWFFQQGNASFGIAPGDRVNQLSMVSNKDKINEIGGFGLPLLSEKELKTVLNAFQPLLNNTIIDCISDQHDIDIFQDNDGNIIYLDPNISLQLPTTQSYNEVIDTAHKVMLGGKIKNVNFFSAGPQLVTPALKEQADNITQDLITQLVVNNPGRMRNLDYVMSQVCAEDSPHMVRNLLNHPALKQYYDQMDFKNSVNNAASKSRKGHRTLYVLYNAGKVDFPNLNKDTLHILLQTGYLYNDPGLIQKSRNALMQKLNEEGAQVKNLKELQDILKFNPSPDVKQEALDSSNTKKTIISGVKIQSQDTTPPEGEQVKKKPSGPKN